MTMYSVCRSAMLMVMLLYCLMSMIIAFQLMRQKALKLMIEMINRM